jgi:hypothetical protein
MIPSPDVVKACRSIQVKAVQRLITDFANLLADEITRRAPVKSGEELQINLQIKPADHKLMTEYKDTICAGIIRKYKENGWPKIAVVQKGEISALDSEICLAIGIIVP